MRLRQRNRAPPPRGARRVARGRNQQTIDSRNRVNAETSLLPMHPASGAAAAVAVGIRVILGVVRVIAKIRVDIDTQIVYLCGSSLVQCTSVPYRHPYTNAGGKLPCRPPSLVRRCST